MVRGQAMSRSRKRGESREGGRWRREGGVKVGGYWTLAASAVAVAVAGASEHGMEHDNGNMEATKAT